jgi:5-methylcytosine-specific restriction endonuclease McrA
LTQCRQHPGRIHPGNHTHAHTAHHKHNDALHQRTPRKSLRANAQPWIARLVKMETLVARFHSRCVYCGKSVNTFEKQPHPISRGGSRGAGNTVLACYDCNQKKGNMDPRCILLTWLWLNPKGFHEAVQRFDALNSTQPTIH